MLKHITFTVPMVLTLSIMSSFPSQAKSIETLKDPQTCFWRGPYDQTASLFPDKNANYWSGDFTIPEGKKVFLKAEYPHSRYMAYVSYHTNGSEYDSLKDESILADSGSTNPFIDGNSRDLPDRNYQITLLPGKFSGDKQSNTLFSGRDDRTMTIWYRIYANDQDVDILGDVDFPEVVVENEDGSTVTGQAACDILQPNPDMFVGTPPSEQQYDELRATAVPQNPGEWQADRLSLYRVMMKNWLYTNPDNKYVELTLSQDWGAVVVLKGKLPTEPKTWAGESPMGSGDLRYWSMCTFEFYTQRYTDCLFDEEVTTFGDSEYIIAISHTDDRPTNATAECGYNWIEWSAAGDGNQRPQDGMVLLRNMDPDPSFREAIQYVDNFLIPADFVDSMGQYLPTANYMSKSEFEALGCPAATR